MKIPNHFLLMNTSIIIADDHPLMLRGLNDFLNSKGYNIVGSASDGQEAYNLIVKLKPDIAVLDIRMPFKTGLEVAEECHKNDLKTKIILITFDKGENLYDRAKDLNVYGYILKEFAIEEIQTCIEHAKEGQPYFSDEIATYLTASIPHAKPDDIKSLTKSELKILHYIAHGKTSQDIANILKISFRTVTTHRSNILNKLKLENRPSSLSLWASKNKTLL
jgi:DNA-binding NarL/FixJ family response regulator